MILIADSGSTKTSWCLCNKQDLSTRFLLTSGINPYYQDEQEILDVLRKEFTSVPVFVESVYFYGAGCANPTVNEKVRNALVNWFKAEHAEVGSDLLAAARSLCGRQPGIACILGTGSNSCYYDGTEIIEHVSPLGFILGDEGSGAVLGKNLLADVLKNQLPDSIIDHFYEVHPISQDEIMENIYRKPFPNRYAARFTRFILENIGEPELRKLVIKQFELFFERNVLQYQTVFHLPVHFSGSIAYHFRDILKEVADSRGLQTGKIIMEPMEGLVDYHLSSHPDNR
jgi:glucosamine kinase